MKALNPEHVIPGHGTPGTAKIFEDTEKYYALLLDRVGAMVKAGKSLDEIKKEVKMPEYDHWATKERFPTMMADKIQMIASTVDTALLYLKKQQDNWAFTALLQTRLMDFLTQTERYPDLAYFKIGEPIGDRVTWYTENRLGMVRYRGAERPCGGRIGGRVLGRAGDVPRVPPPAAG